MLEWNRGVGEKLRVEADIRKRRGSAWGKTELGAVRWCREGKRGGPRFRSGPGKAGPAARVQGAARRPGLAGSGATTGTRASLGERQGALAIDGLAAVQGADADGDGGCVAGLPRDLKGAEDQLAAQRRQRAAGAREGVAVASE